MVEILSLSVLIMLASLVGIFSIWHGLGKIIERNLDFLISFSAGVFLVIAYHLGVEVIEHSGDLSVAFAWILAGVIGIWLFFKFIPFFHHHHSDEDPESHLHNKLDAKKIMFGDAVHNIGDGILLASSVAVSSSLGLFAGISIFIHELVQEMSEFFVLRQAGYSTKKALLANLAISSTILIGALGSFFLLERFEALEVPVLGIASGSFLTVVLHDLIPHSVKASRREEIYLKHIVWFALGAGLMYLVTTLAAH